MPVAVAVRAALDLRVGGIGYGPWSLSPAYSKLHRARRLAGRDRGDRDADRPAVPQAGAEVGVHAAARRRCSRRTRPSRGAPAAGTRRRATRCRPGRSGTAARRRRARRRPGSGRAEPVAGGVGPVRPTFAPPVGAGPPRHPGRRHSPHAATARTRGARSRGADGGGDAPETVGAQVDDESAAEDRPGRSARGMVTQTRRGAAATRLQVKANQYGGRCPSRASIQLAQQRPPVVEPLALNERSRRC